MVVCENRGRDPGGGRGRSLEFHVPRRRSATGAQPAITVARRRTLIASLRTTRCGTWVESVPNCSAFNAFGFRSANLQRIPPMLLASTDIGRTALAFLTP